MRRYAPSFSIIPREGEQGRFTLWVSYTIWDDERCVKTIPVFNCTVELTPEPANSNQQVLEFMVEATDLLYQQMSRHYAEFMARVSETNARPADTSVPFTV
jgi:hypothetical protein